MSAWSVTATSDASETDLECEVLIDGVEDALTKLVAHQLHLLEGARRTFEQEKQLFEEQKGKVLEIMNLKKVSSATAIFFHQGFLFETFRLDQIERGRDEIRYFTGDTARLRGLHAGRNVFWEVRCGPRRRW